MNERMEIHEREFQYGYVHFPEATAKATAYDELVASTRAVFEARLKTLNYPRTRKGDGYRSVFVDGQWRAVMHCMMEAYNATR